MHHNTCTCPSHSRHHLHTAMPGPYTTPTTRARIYQRRHDGESIESIARDLGKSAAIMYNVLKKSREGKSFYYTSPNTGLPHALTPRTTHRIIRGIKSGEFWDATDAQRQLVPHVSVHTVRRQLHQAGMEAHVHPIIPLLTKSDLKHRLGWSYKNRNVTLDEWRQCVFSDESKFN